ncbi:T9SS type A sorting domain-containing protein [Bacteroidota bacterium]
MKKIILILLFLPLILSGQDIIWEKTFNPVEDHTISVIYTLEALEGGYYILCSNTGGTGKTILKLDIEGNKEWDFSFGGIDDPLIGGFLYQWRKEYVLYAGLKTNDILFIDAGYFYILNSTNYGKYLWHYFGKGDGGRIIGYPHQMKLANEKGFLVTGSYKRLPENKCYLRKTDEFGREIWTNYYSDTVSYDTMQPGTPIETVDSNYIFNYNLIKKGNNTKYGFIKTDTAGNMIWQRKLNNNHDKLISDQIHLSKDNGIVALFKKRNLQEDTTFFNLVKIDEQGIYEWEKDYNYSHYNLPQTLFVTDDGGYLIGGSTLIKDSVSSIDRYDFYYFKTDVLGNMEWENSYNRSNKDFIEYVMQCSDGHYLVSGRSNDSAYIAKIKNPTVPVEENVTKTDFYLSDPHPNPVNSFCTFHYSTPESGNVQIRMLDVQGRVIDKPVDKYLSAGKHSLMIDLSNYSNGLYICQLIVNNRIINKKLIVLK